MAIADPTLTATDANAALIDRFYKAFAAGNAEAASAYLTPDFIMHVPGRGLNAGDYWGPDGFLRFVENIQSYNGGRFDVRLAAVAVSEDQMFTWEIVTLNRRADPEIEWELRFLMHYVVKNGRISEAWTVPEDATLYDAYWTPGSPMPSPGRRFSPADAGPTGSTSARDNVALIERWYGHFWNGELERMRASMHEDFTWHTPGTSHLAGDYRGWDGYLAFRDKLLALAGDKYKLDIAGIAASETDAFVKEHIRMNLKRDPTVRTVEVILHFEMENGQIVNVDDIPLDLHAYEAFFRA